MKILITTPSFSPEINGVATASYWHYIGLKNYGHQVKILTSRSHSDHDDLFNEDLIRLNAGGAYVPWKYYHGNIKEFIDEIILYAPDVIISECWNVWSTDWITQLPDSVKARKILFSHGFSANSIRQFPIDLLRWCGWRPYCWFKVPRIIEAFDHFVFLADQKDADRFFDRKIVESAGKPFTIIPNGVARPAAANPVKVRDRKHHVLLNISEYSQLKNQKFLIDIVSEIGRQDIKLILCGQKQNSYLEFLQRHAFSLKLSADRVQFLVGRSGSDLHQLYADADIFLFSSLTECLPIVLLDSISHGVPFVSTDTGAIRTIAGGIVANTKSEFLLALNRLLDEQATYDDLVRLGEKAVSESYNWDVVGAALNDLCYVTGRKSGENDK